MKNTQTVAVVQDDLFYQAILKQLLKSSDLFFDVLAFDNGLSAIEHLKQNNTANQLPDIILLDLGMPIMDGWAFLDAYQQLSPILSKYSQIFIHSASVYQSDLRKAKQHSCVTGVVPAPFKIKELKQYLGMAHIAHTSL